VTIVPFGSTWLIMPAVLAVGSCSSGIPPRDAAVAPEPPHLMCQEQIQGVRPIPTGVWRERYLTSCLLEHDFRSYVRERQWCNMDRDCTIVDTQCPFGCGVVVATKYASAVSGEHGRLLAEYSKTAACKYKCRPITSVQCVDNRCS
jgi:hypothetical protein